MKKVSIITVNYNHSYLTEALLASIATTNLYSNIEIVVVDNGSKENPVPQWQQEFPEIIFIRSEINLGFAGGNNLGINKATGDYYFLINNDTEVTPNLIDLLIDTLEANEKIGIISPLIKYFQDKKTIQYAGYTELNFNVMRDNCIGEGEIDLGQYHNKCYEVGSAHGAAMMISKSVADKCGLMAENYFLYYEELDWSYRIKNMGYQVWVNTNAIIYHKESMSVGKNSELKVYFMNRNRLLFIRRNGTFLNQIIFFVYFICIVAPRNCIQYLKTKNENFVPVLFKAIWWNFTNGINSTYLGIDLKRNK